MMSVTDQINRFIEVKRFKRKELANALGTTPQTISNLMTGRNRPGIDLVQKFAESFPNLNIRWLLTGKGDMFDDQNSVLTENMELKIKLEACEDLCKILKRQLDDKEKVIVLLEQKVAS